ncbi:hypothetical protein [Eleftheria terrae]|uniref:hypothetical protein n=1 Tax=Eleftheria terrae TaxID=1597781 RepID=UPI00263B85F1|nr:hypothetical protein [Eleftheria terrae]WKB52769.1 hypothetical protein N7L95_23830 [Eleftheria terrae]
MKKIQDTHTSVAAVAVQAGVPLWRSCRNAPHRRPAPRHAAVGLPSLFDRPAVAASGHAALMRLHPPSPY